MIENQEEKKSFEFATNFCLFLRTFSANSNLIWYCNFLSFPVGLLYGEQMTHNKRYASKFWNDYFDIEK